MTTRYYLGIRDDTGVWPDEESLKFDTHQEAKAEAAATLAGLAVEFA